MPISKNRGQQAGITETPGAWCWRCVALTDHSPDFSLFAAMLDSWLRKWSFLRRQRRIWSGTWLKLGVQGLSPEVAQSLPSAAATSLQIHEFDSLLLWEGRYSGYSVLLHIMYCFWPLLKVLSAQHCAPNEKGPVSREFSCLCFLF